MDEPARSQWEIRCAFNGFCKKVLKREAINAHRDVKHRQMYEVTFSDLSPQEENQLYSVDEYFADKQAVDGFNIAGKVITSKLLADALHALPKEKHSIILLYYFDNMSDEEIARLHGIPRSTVQYRRKSSFEQLKQYLEEHAYDDEDE